MWSGEAIELKLVNGLVRIFQAKKGRPSVNVGHFRLQVCLFWVQGSEQPREIRDSGSGWRLTWLSRTGLRGGSLFSDLSLSFSLYTGNWGPPDTPVTRSIKWLKLTYPPHPPTTLTPNTPLITNIDRCLPFKYLPRFCYYTYGSFKPPKETSQGHWKREKTGYDIYNPIKSLRIAVRVPGLQNNLRAKMMAIHHTLRILTTTYRDEPTHIFTDCLSVMYLLNTQIKHPTLHNSHPYKNILKSNVAMLHSCTQITTIHKVKAHASIHGHEQANTLAKIGCELDHRDTVMPYDHAHPTPYYLQKDWWHSKKHQTKAL